jgi:hypothetical protein
MPDGATLKSLVKGPALGDELILGFRFRVDFLAGRKGLDIRFQKVSGLSREVETTPLVEGGENLYSLCLPERIKHDNLILERGLVVDSRLSDRFNEAMSLFKFASYTRLCPLKLESCLSERLLPKRNRSAVPLSSVARLLTIRRLLRSVSVRF